jgi:uncharacterized protein
MSSVNRRAFLRNSLAVAGGTLLVPSVFDRLAAHSALLGAGHGVALAAPGDGGYGALIPSADTSDLALPAGFRARKFGATGSIMTDGIATPSSHDGMAAFPRGANLRLVRNHERTGTAGVSRPFGNPATAYDPNGQGGTTTLEVEPTGERNLVRHFASLNGTLTNCAGGLTPWDSWLTCEETTRGTLDGWQRNHGYIFEVPSGADDEVQAVPLKAMGRFVHEAVAIDPTTGIAYETEDRGTSGLYRFIPTFANNLAAGGRLQMLKIKDRWQYNARTGQHVGRPLPVEWVDIADPDPATTSNSNSLTVYNQGFVLGGATFARLEGIWYGNRAMYFNSTSGGDAGVGQVWEYRPLGNSGGQLTLIFESPNVSVLDAPDNICVTPRGGLLLCEDGGGEQYLRGLTTRGQIFDFAKNLANDNEFAGATFSPDGQTLFVNIQTPGATYAIWGPWANGAL